jgi:hypothetical protein
LFYRETSLHHSQTGAVSVSSTGNCCNPGALRHTEDVTLHPSQKFYMKLLKKELHNHQFNNNKKKFVLLAGHEDELSYPYPLQRLKITNNSLK